ncbi:unnamed protein product [Adineta ricciae]|uniref:G-protein coupled receptors family 1 profile domain-containing protein n=1 Tax=Adineta ricciae TaxID=249248 RepID=A0A813Q5B8_ADIRI|nr:unnamed protein product [Adineta ricciae]
MSSSPDIAYVILAAQKFSSISAYVNFCFGLIGNLLTILIFMNLKIFHRNRCAFYLIAECLVDLGQLSQLFANEIWALSLNEVDPTKTSLIWCKLRTIMPQWCRLMLASIVCYAAIDQFFSTHYHRHFRQYSSLEMAKFQIGLAGCLCLAHTIPAGVFLNIDPVLGCVISSQALVNYYSYAFYPFLSGVIPTLISSVFSLLAYRNVRRIIRRQIPLERRKLDQQLTAMIFVRVIFFIWLQLPFTVYRIFSIRWVMRPGNTVAYAATRWAQVISTTLAYTSHAANFYIFYATSIRYRRQVKYFFTKRCALVLRRCCGRHPNVVQPLETLSGESGSELK